MQGPFKGDQVGSLLRTDKLKKARKDFEANIISKKALRTIEDVEIKKLIEKQKEIGLSAVTDGEYRRKYWHADFISGLNGIETYEEETPGFFHGELKTLTKYVVADKLNFPENHPFLADFSFVKQAAGENHVAKFTIPGPNMIFNSGVISNERYRKSPVYDSLDEVGHAIAKVYQDAIQAFYKQGCRYLQLDDTSWGSLFNPSTRQALKAQGHDLDQLTHQFADITIESLRHKPKDMTITMHICRGNFKSAWLYEGDYEPIAKYLFSKVPVDGFFLEFDTDRAGGFEPLRFIKQQKVILGLITSKNGELENQDQLLGRIEEASQFVPKSQLCISPQCGFASTEEGNILTEEDQWNKLKLVLDTANKAF